MQSHKGFFRPRSALTCLSDVIVTVVGSGVADFAAAEQTKPKASVAGC